MKKLGLVIFFMALTIVMGGATTLRADNHIIKISSDPWEPWVIGNEGEAPTGGLAIDITKELFNRLDLDFQIKIYPYERCIRQMKDGERDVLLMVKKTEEREQYMLFSDVAATESQLLFYSTDHMDGFQWQAWEDLKGYMIGGVKGFNYSDFEVAAKTHQLKMERIANDTQNIRKLLSGRVDLIILNRSTAKYYMDNNPEVRGKLKAAKQSISESEFHFALSKKGKATAHLSNINAALQAMKADGTLGKILGLYE